MSDLSPDVTTEHDVSPEDALLTLENTYEWQPRAIIVGIVTLVMIVATIVSRSPGWVLLVLSLLFLYALYCGLLWLRQRPRASFDQQGRLIVRGMLGTKTVEPGEVTKVKEIVNGRSPDVKLVTPHGGVVVATSKLQAGHSTLFQWLEETQPQAVYDKGATKLLARLRAGGYLDGTRNPLADDSWGINDVYSAHAKDVQTILGRTGNQRDF